MTVTHDYTGLWVTPGGGPRKLLLPNGRFVSVRGSTGATGQGEYRIVGDHIEFVGDDGGTGEADFIDGVLRHGAFALYLEGFDERAAA